MKEFLKSFFSSTKSNRNICLLAFSLLVSVPAFSQVNNGPDSLQLASIVWKPKADVIKTLKDEVIKLDAYLATSGLQEVDRAVFLAEKHLVIYVQDDVQAGMLVNESIMINYRKVLTDAKTDPLMDKLPYGMLGTYVPGLIEALTAVPKPIAH